MGRVRIQPQGSQHHRVRRIFRTALIAILVAAALHASEQAFGGAFVPPPTSMAAKENQLVLSRQNLPSGNLPAPAELLIPAAGVLLGGLGMATGAAAVLDSDVDLSPETFRPVCPASDGLYNIGKGAADALLGADGAEYRPLAIEALLRVRLEICVLESFVYEAIVPFVAKKGLGWILPLHETIDTVIAGTVFIVALNFILFGTTKILAVLSIYHDFLLGAPLRLVGFAVYPEKRVRADPPLIQINWPGRGEDPQPEPEEEEEQKERDIPAPLVVIGTVCKTYGIFSEILKNVLEGLDTFVGRYLVLFSVAYVAFKWAHFRLFPEFPPF
mmetsp:Transcript_14489/g.31793  ORF Transcript_14489/g.31793 Transcript_14489/m.31793 type:complete len:329 (-) Transcript_14489:79-1065(-)